MFYLHLDKITKYSLLMKTNFGDSFQASLHTVITLHIETNLSKQCRPDQMTPNMASDQGLHCLPLIQWFLVAWTGSQMDLYQILGQIWYEFKVSKHIRKIWYVFVET